MEYVRYLDGEGDIGRVARQQEFIKALLQEVTKPKNIVNIPELVRIFSSIFKTDMPLTKMLSFATIIDDVAKAGLITDSMPGALADINEISYVIPNIKEIRRIVAKNQSITPDARYNSITEKLAKEVKQSLPGNIEVTDYDMINIKNEKPAKPDKTKTKKEACKVKLINASGNPQASRKLAEYLRHNGFSITITMSSARIMQHTTVILATNDFSVENKVNKFPFEYNLFTDEPDKDNPEDLLIEIGQDINAGLEKLEV